MDYSKYTSSILTNYLILAGAVILGIVLSIMGEVYLTKVFIKQNAEQSGYRILFFNNKESIIDFFGIIAVSVVLLLILFWSRNVLADIPNAIRRDFQVTTGIVVGQDAAGLENVGENRGFELQDLKTGEIINLQVFYTPIRKNEIYEVIYLPHTKSGAIVKKIVGGELS